MEQGLIGKIARAYGLQPLGIDAPQTGYRNASYRLTLAGGRVLNLIIYKREPDIEATIRRANAVGDFLATRGFAARATVSPRLIRLQSGRFASLYNYLPGQTIPWDDYTMERLKNVGGAMSQMHFLLADFDGELPNALDQLEALAKRMRRYFAQAGVASAMRRKLQITEVQKNIGASLATCHQLPAQALHLDFVRGNVLFGSNNITGVIDFEKAALGPPILDIARTLAFLLVDCKHKTEPKIRKYFIDSGYNKRGPVRFSDDQQLLEPLIDFFLIHDFYKFLRHNPYESLSQNEHFTRTIKLLERRGQIRYN